MWDAVRVITGRRQELPAVEGVTAESLNQHYVKISTDAHYQQPKYKTAVTQSFDECRYMSDWNMFRILDSLPTQPLVWTICRRGFMTWRTCILQPFGQTF